MKNSIFDSCKLHINGINYVCPVEVPELLAKGAQLVDIREDFEIFLKTFLVENIIYLPFKTIKRKVASIKATINLWFSLSFLCSSFL